MNNVCKKEGLNLTGIASALGSIVIVGGIVTMIAIPVRDFYHWKKSYDTLTEGIHKAQQEEQEYENSLRFSDNGATVDVPVEKGSDKYITMNIEYDSYGNEYFVNPNTSEYKLYKRESNLVTGGGLFPTIDRINEPLPWGQKGVLKEGQTIADK